MEESKKNPNLFETNLVLEKENEKPSQSANENAREHAEPEQNAENLLAQAREEMQKRLSIEMARLFGQ